MVKNELVRQTIEFFVNVMPPATVQLEGDIATGISAPSSAYLDVVF
jgi:hypothetical protein